MNAAPVNSKKPFKLEAARDAMSAIIPQGSIVDRLVEKWSLEDLNSYIIKEGFTGEVLLEDFKIFRKLPRNYPSGMKEEFILFYASEPVEPTPAVIEWLNDPDFPRDMVSAGKACLRIVPPTPPCSGTNVRGGQCPPRTLKEFPLFEAKLSEGLILLENNTIEPVGFGQVKVTGNEIKFSPIYEISNPALPEYKNLEFHCDVVVHGDLDANVHWTVNGNLTVEGHWSTSTIIVKKNVLSVGGIQTNMQGTLKFYGNCEANYIQMSRVGIAGNLLVHNALLLSEVRVGGDVRCTGAPGAIMGSSVTCYGSLIANRAGSEKGKPTDITLFSNTLKAKSHVQALAAGTRMCIYGSNWTVPADCVFEADGETVLV